MQPPLLRIPLRRTALTAAGLLAVLLASAAPALAAPSADPAQITSPASATTGADIEIAVTIPDAVDVFAYEIEITFDPSLVEYVDDSATGAEGGFTTATVTGSSLVVTSTRLGTSPALDGTIDALEVHFTATGTGDATFALTRVTLVGTDTTSTVFADVASTTTTLSAPADGTTPSNPADSDSDSDSGTSAGGNSTPTPAASSQSDDTSPTTSGLASTGANILLPVGIALAIIATGVVLVLMRRKAQR